MKNITVSLSEEEYRQARITAAERNTSVSALVREFLSGLRQGESVNEGLKREERELRARIEGFRAGDRLDRDGLHRRGT